MKRRVAMSLLASICVLGLAACGSDEEGSSAEEEIRSVLTENLTATDRTEIECETTVTDDYVERVYGGMEECRDLVVEPDSELTEQDDLDFEAIDIDGSEASVQVEVREGRLQGVGGGLVLVEDPERGWLLDRFDGDFARSSTISSLRSQLDPQSSLCVEEGLFGPQTTDREAQDIFVGISREDEETAAQVTEVIEACAKAVGGAGGNQGGDDQGSGNKGGKGTGGGGSGAGPGEVDPANFDRDQFDRSFKRGLVEEQGLSKTVAGCVVERLGGSLSDEEAIKFVETSAEGEPPPRAILRKVDRAAAACAAKRGNSKRA